MSTPDCSCTWTGTSVPLMTSRDPSCTRHGDESDWWRTIRAHAEKLSNR